ncbi:MAG: Transposase, IS4 family [Firmicutes bacterium]|nr:Transposase, IS4 family [Bacillota bacterium]
MAYRVHQVNKKTGVTYIYEATSVWDKEKKQPRNKQVCIGKLDPKTGEFIPSKRLNPEQAAVRDPAVSATAKIIGPTLLLDSITAELELDKVLKSCFPKVYQQILCMAYYLAMHGGSLSHCEAWSKSHAHPFNKTLTSQRISEILQSLNIDGQQTFFSKWGESVLENDYLCYDITSVSSYGELNEYIKYGYNRDGDKLRQINLALLFGQKSQLPVYYHRLPGNISDVSTLHHFLKTFSYLELPKLHLVMDKGFYSQKNVDELLAAKDKFILAVPNRLKWVQHIIDETRDTIQNPESYRKLDGEILYVHTKLYPWGKERRRCYVHLYYNAHAAAEAIDSFTEELLTYKEELESGQMVSNHEDAYKTFFVIKETPVRGRKVFFNNETIQKYRNQYAGFYALLTNDIKDPVEALRVYRNKDTVEKCFDDLKNQLDMKRLRIHSAASMDGRLFVQFIALIFISALRKKMRDTGLIDKYTTRELLLEMETLTKVRYSGKYGHILTEVTKPQSHILESLGINLET